MALKSRKVYSTPDLAKIAVNYQQIVADNLVQQINKYSEIFEKVLEIENSFSYFFMLNFTNMQYAFVSKSVETVLGHTPKDYLEGGLDFAFSVVHPADKPTLKELHSKLFDYYYATPIEERKDLKFTFNLRIRRPDDSYIQAMQQTIFAEISETGEPLLDFSTITDITPFKKDNRLSLAVYKLNSSRKYDLIYEQDFFGKDITLTKRQLEIMDLISRGLTTKEIADKLFISADTVKNHRKKILKVTGGKNSIEALTLGAN